ncbi:MAG: sigma-70 family RNA polymerase sigma factor [Phycisphaerales bacterium]|nr:MAG: sigma-70 family RNA polymerase sigma factor [Phycisphaerales bacterium]
MCHLLEVGLRHVQDKLERKLVEQAVGGDIDSFGELCRRYYAATVAIAYSILSDHQLAEDAAQESFARALVGLRSLKQESRFAPWLAAVCRNVSKDMVAAKTKRIRGEHLPQVSQDNNCDEDIRMLRRAMGRLPAPARELIVLRYYNNLSYQEISSVLGVSKATINGRLTRAKRKLAKCLRQDGFLESRL